MCDENKKERGFSYMVFLYGEKKEQRGTFFYWWGKKDQKKEDQRKITIFQKPTNTEVYPTE